MVTKQLEEWASRNQCRFVHNENSEFNIIEKRTNEGYAFSISAESDTTAMSVAQGLVGVLGSAAMSSLAKKYVIGLAIDVNTWKKEMLKNLKNELKGLASPSFVKGHLFLMMKKNSHTDDTYSNMMTVIDKVSKLLYQQGVKMPDSCIYCKQDCCDDFDTTKKTGTFLQPAHSRCVQKNVREALEKLEERKRKEGYFPALLVLLIGLVIGCIPAVFVLLGGYYGGIVNFIMYIFIPIIGVSFYRKANGTAKGGIFPILLILTVVVISALVIFGDFLWLNEEYGGLGWGLYWAGITYDFEYITFIAVEAIISWLTGLAGVVIAFNSLRNKSKNNNARLEALRRQSTRQTVTETSGTLFRYGSQY